jgi:hypothetical protein
MGDKPAGSAAQLEELQLRLSGFSRMLNLINLQMT